MGSLNGESSLSSSSKKGKKRVGFALTADGHYHLKGKRLTNVSAPVDNHDATTKRFVTDPLKNKAGTTYVNNELAKKASQSNVNKALAALNNKVEELEATVGELKRAVL